jgi:hypothetical protein
MAILHLLEADFFYQLLAVFRGHKHGSSVGAGAGVERANAKLPAAVIALVFYHERAYAYVGKKIAEDHHRLCAAVGIRFIGQANLDIVVYVAGQFGGIAGIQGGNHLVQATADRLERAGYYKKKYREKRKNAFH